MAVNSQVGGGILNIITESLYDKPIVVFREYVQNAVDSLRRAEEKGYAPELLSCDIVTEGKNLYFIDNGVGIEPKNFENRMKSIALSEKKRTSDIGYKGIGRLSGVSYSEKIVFVNILSYQEHRYQVFSVSANLYNKLKNSDKFSSMTFEEVMGEISLSSEELKDSNINNVLIEHERIFSDMKRDKGFLVCLINISTVLCNLIEDSENIKKELGWLLPVKFKDELMKKSTGNLQNDYRGDELFSELSEKKVEDDVVPAKAFHIRYNGEELERPIEKNMLRDCLCQCEFGKYAVGFHCFPKGKFVIDAMNRFQGIRIYIDNMLLCDETEIIPMLLQNHLIGHTSNELLQTVRSVGVMIYITDKINIVANARRTFIETVDQPAIEFLELLVEFIERIYDARYTMSRWFSLKNNSERDLSALEKVKKKAIENLNLLAQRDIQVELNLENFKDLPKNEQQIRAKKKIQKKLNEKLTDYLLEASEINYENAYDDFLQWLMSNYHT